MRLLALIVSVLVASPAAAQVVTEMTPERVREAIADKTVERCYPLATGVFYGDPRYAPDPSKLKRIQSSYGCFETPYSRVASAARAATKKYQPFTEADATADQLAPEVRLCAWNRNEAGSDILKARVEAIVVMPAEGADRTAAIQPTRTLYKTQQAIGFLCVAFPLSALSAANEVRIVYDRPIQCYAEGGYTVDGKPATECAVRFKLDDVK